MYHPTPGTDGPGGIWPVTPIDGVSDDWPRLMGTIAPIAVALGLALQMCPGPNNEPWQCLSPGEAPSGLVIYGTPETVVTGSVSGSPLANAPFYQLLDPVIAVGTSAPVAIGATTLSVTIGTAPIVGEWLMLRSPAPTNDGQYFEIKKVVGAGPYTVTIDRPVAHAFTGVPRIEIFPTAKTMRIEGNGMLVSGAFDWVIVCETPTRNAYFSDINVDESIAAMNPGNGCFLFDTACYNCIFERCRILGSTTIMDGFLFAAPDSARAIDCVANSLTAAGSVGFGLNDVINCHLVRPTVDGASRGIGIGTDGGVVTDPHSWYSSIEHATVLNVTTGIVQGTAVHDFSIHGARIVAGTGGGTTGMDMSANVVASDVKVEGALTGISISAGPVQLTDATVTGYGDVGVVVANAKNVTLQSLDLGTPLTSAATAGLALSGGSQVQAEGVTMFGAWTGTDVPVVYVHDAGSQLTMLAPYIRKTSLGSGGAHVVQAEGGGIITAIGGTVGDETNGAYAFLSVGGGSVIVVRDTTVTGNRATAATGGGTLRHYAMRTPTATDIDGAGGFFNVGTVLLNGVTPVPISFPDLQKTDRIFYTLITPGGTLGTLVAGAETAGSGFAPFSTNALDTSTYRYEIVG